MERRAAENGDIVLEINSAGAVENRPPRRDQTGEHEKNGDTNGAGAGPALRPSMSFGQAYKMRHRTPQVFTTWQTAVLSFQSLGIVYGDLGTSPLYVFPSVVLPGADERDFLGILSLILWTLTLTSGKKPILPGS